MLLSSVQRWLTDQKAKSPDNDQVPQKKKSWDSLPDPSPALWSHCPWSMEAGVGICPSSSPLLPCSIPAELTFLLSFLAVTMCQQHSNSFHRHSKLLTRLNNTCLTWPLPTLISSVSSLHHPRHSFSSTNELPAFPQNLCHVLSCFHILELCWEAPTDSTR